MSRAAAIHALDVYLFTKKYHLWEKPIRIRKVFVPYEPHMLDKLMHLATFKIAADSRSPALLRYAAIGYQDAVMAEFQGR